MSLLSTYLGSRAQHPTGQFGQTNDVSTWDGKTGCGQTSVQTILRAFRSVTPTHDELSKLMGYWRPANLAGTSAEQLAKALGHWIYYSVLGVRRRGYKAAYGLSLADLRAATAKGPVILVVKYRLYPTWKGYKGVARPAPYAAPLGKAGRNQFPSPDILHWVVLAGTMAGGTYAGKLAVMEPNHRSGARPEAVPIDYIALVDLDRAYRAGGLIAVIPTRSIA